VVGRRLDPPRFVLAGLLGVLVLSVGGVGAALADGVKLVLLPVDQPGPYFDVTMRPGDTRAFDVSVGDAATVPVSVRTYAADVYTIVNGGFGGRLRDEARTGMTSWVAYPTETLQLQARQTVHRRFTVTVPLDAGPGEYIASLVLENEKPIHADGTFTVDQFVRQAVAVVVTVPGERLPRLTIGAASHEVVAGRSIVSIAVANPGNVRLKPAVAFTLFDASGATISQTTVRMDTFYARTDTFVEVPLVALLQPGTYTIRLSLDDPEQRARAEAAAIPLVVAAPATVARAEGAPPELAAVDQGPAPGPQRPPIELIAMVGALLATVVIGSLLLGRMRRRAMPGSKP
jgi:hypothetical protein